MTLPVRHDFVQGDKLGAVVHGLGHPRIGSIDVLTVAECALEVEVVHRSRDLETQFNAHVALVYTAECQVGEGVLEVIVVAHHVGLVLDCGVESRNPGVPVALGELPVDVSGEVLHRHKVVNQGVPGPRGEEGLVEGRSLGEVTHVAIYPHVSAYPVFEPAFRAVGEEVLMLGIAI